MPSRMLSAAALLSLSSLALAGPAGEAAQDHFKAIASGQLDKLMGQYQNQATLYWIGGPLDGAYSGKDSLKEVWSKFSNAQGPLTVKVADLQESVNPKGATVTANVAFTGKNAIKVRYVLVYRDNKLVNEIWQIDPALSL